MMTEGTYVVICATLGLALLVYFRLKPSSPMPIPVPEKQSEPKRKRRQVKDVEPGEKIQIEWYKIEGGIGYGKCISNDPETGKILLEFTWSNYQQMKWPEKTKVIFDYKDAELANFSLLNPEVIMPPPPKKPKQQQQPIIGDTGTTGGDIAEESKSILKSVYCNYGGHLIVHDVHGEKIQELSGEMTLEKCKEIESRSQDGITEIEGNVDVYNRIYEKLKK